MTLVVRRFFVAKNTNDRKISMSKKIDKEQIAREICKVAKLYKEHLVGRRFVYVFDSRSMQLRTQEKPEATPQPAVSPVF